MSKKQEIRKVARVEHVETVRPSGTDSAKVVQVIETKSTKGAGTESDLSRQVTQYWSLEGKLLAEYDPSRETLADD